MFGFLSEEEPKKVKKFLMDPDWAMQRNMNSIELKGRYHRS